MYGLSSTSVVRMEKSGDGGSTLSVFPIGSVVIFFILVSTAVFVVFVVVSSSSWLPKVISHDEVYHSL